MVDLILFTAKLGPLGFFKGYIPAFIRLAPQTILTFVFLEQLQSHFGYLPTSATSTKWDLCLLLLLTTSQKTNSNLRELPKTICLPLQYREKNGKLPERERLLPSFCDSHTFIYRAFSKLYYRPRCHPFAKTDDVCVCSGAAEPCYRSVHLYFLY